GRLVDVYIERGKVSKSAGNIYIGRVQNVLEGINSCFVDIGKGKNAFLPISDYSGDIRKNEMIVVQVVKEEVQDKGAKITGKISILGGLLIFMPNEGKIGVSRNIQEEKERERLKTILEGMAPKGGGFIARTASEKKTKREIVREGKFLMKLWSRINREIRKAKKSNKPVLVYEESDIVTYAAREFLDKNTKQFLINDRETYKKVKAFVRKIFPEFNNKIQFYDSDLPLFERYKVEAQIENLKKRKIPLDCGGYIIIEQTEALTAIDVNTGSFTGDTDRETTAMKVNEEAARIAASQIILRDIGGIIIIDFIDLENRSNRQKLLNIMREEMKIDKAKLRIYPMSRLGLIELTRQRRKESILNVICQDCPYCSGSGMIYSEFTMYVKIKRELLRKGPNIKGKKINLYLHPKIADVFTSKGFEDVENQLKKKINIKKDYRLHQEEYNITS
ncbi:MAG: Rne/Rng family ribonuclease, partial [Elusimicrobia bacterium]|nr:Rne/Rng family ribonuclease [Elusimicrobiota bacterium]